jgi:hypothetical protein
MGAGRRVSCPIQDDDGERARLRFDLDKRTADRPAVCGGFRVPLFPEVGVLFELRRPAPGLSRCRQAQSPTPGRSFSGRSSLPPGRPVLVLAAELARRGWVLTGGPHRSHVGDAVKFSLRYSDEHVARELGEPPPLDQAATRLARGARPGPGARA